MKILIYSHSKDIDGLGAVVLAKLAFKEIDYELFPSPKELNDKVIEDIKNHKYDEYDRVYITDLTLPDPAISYVEYHAKDKVRVFDHHHTAILNNYHLYDFCTIRVNDKDGTLTCGTRLFYEYLTLNGLLEPTPSINDFVEKVRLEDTWDWKKSPEGAKAHDLSILHSELGNEKFLSHMLDTLQNKEEFFLSLEDEQTIKNKKETTERVLNQLLSEMEYFTDEDNNKFGMVFSTHEYVNDLAQRIRDLNNPNQLEYIIVVCLDSSSRSYRSMDYNNFNVAKIAVSHGGGGQFGAAGAGLNEEHKNKILTMNKRDSLAYLAKVKYQG